MKLRTGISQAFSFVPGREPSFTKAMTSHTEDESSASERPLCWFDELLKGGITLPRSLPEPAKQEEKKEEDRAVTILLTGPPGGGKSTLALELCYRLTREDDHREFMKDGANSLYITSEAKVGWVKDKVRSYGWEDVERVFFSAHTIRREGAVIPIVTVWETTDFNDYLASGEGLGFFRELLEGQVPFGAQLGKFVDKGWEVVNKRILLKHAKIPPPKVLVIDSVNTVEAQDQAKTFSSFMEIARNGPRVVVIILDAEPENRKRVFWSYVADIVIRLDRRQTLDYMTRTIEIVKARYQPHVEGVHQLKIYPPTKVVEPTSDHADQMRRAHPYREEGGIFLYPSIHYYLSLNKRQGPLLRPDVFPAPISQLRKTLHGGFPMGRCTGLIGGRGGHKSHLGYLCLLSRIVDRQYFQNQKEFERLERSQDGEETALVVSLRDDEGVAHQALDSILTQQYNIENDAERVRKEMEADGTLEILYYPPGFITPEEFFHRMYMSVKRLKKRGRRVSVLFNSLDQLAARFPLCAEQRSFIPGIIEILTAEEITSFFIAVEEPGQPQEQYGLLAMADALLSIQHVSLFKKDYIGHLKEAGRQVSADSTAAVADLHETVTLRIVRFAGGQAGGPGGILELVDSGDPGFQLYNDVGLHFSPFSPSYARSVEERKILAEGTSRHAAGS
jgi:KaiC/GvpD/RAD55 family RecA-like ATPase